MICSSKTEFLTSLRVALERNNVTDTRDILTDFRQHFEDGAAAGETEAEVCEKLGDIEEIIKQYVSETDTAETPKSAPAPDAGMPDTSGFGADSFGNPAPPPYSQPRYAEPARFQPSAGKIVGILCLDVFIYSWALPTLAGLIVALISIAISFSLSGMVVFIASIFTFFTDLGGIIVTGLAPLSLLFFGLMTISLGGMLVIASIGSVKGLINIFIAIVNSHAKVFAGHKIWNKIGRKKEAYDR
ncbi:MAG: DUF1700 domain-containing protein [Ruminiclostridium sp.]|nr:DUF1700 domain-containing protein [Ruminiclostridium sp.]